MLLYSDGSKLAQSLPFGFPQDLDQGTYAITVAGTICTIFYTDTSCYTETTALPTLSLGTIQLTSFTTLAKRLSQAAHNVAEWP